METKELKRLIIKSLDENQGNASELIRSDVSFDFSSAFEDKVLDNISREEIESVNEQEFSRFLSIAFSRVALTGVAAIVLLLISLFMMEGSLSFNSILGMPDIQNEDMVYLLTGN